MSYSQLFEHDQQFMRLVRRETDVDLVIAALEIARDGQTDLMFEPTRVRLQRSVARLTHPVTQAGSDVEELKLLIRHMTEELNLRGDDDCFSEPDASYLNRVLETGRGIPISLSLIYLNVANELGIPLEPIAAPSHFLTRLQTDTGNLYVDAFDNGRIMDEPECIEWLHGITELPVAEIRRSFKPVDERTIMIRMLNNLESIVRQSGNVGLRVACPVPTVDALARLLPRTPRPCDLNSPRWSPRGSYGPAARLPERLPCG